MVLNGQTTGVLAGLLLLAGCSSLGSSNGETANPQQVTPFAATQTENLTLPDELVDAIGRRNSDRAIQAQLSALENGQTGIPIVWRYAGSIKTAQVVPGPDYSINGRSCRDFNHIVEVKNTRREFRGIACQDSNGKWRSLEG